MAEMKSPNVHAKKNRNDTPQKRKTHIIKVRVTAEKNCGSHTPAKNSTSPSPNSSAASCTA